MSDITQSSGRGPQHWRSLNELADSEDFRRQLENEFPEGIEPPEGMTRRRFLQIMSASIAMTTLAGCRWPTEKIVPFAAGLIVGEALTELSFSVFKMFASGGPA